MGISNISIGVLLLVSIVEVFENKRFHFKKVGLGYFLVLFLLVSVVWLLFSCSPMEGLKKIEKTSSFIIFPFVFGAIQWTKPQIRKLGIVFSITTFSAVTLALIIASLKAIEHGSPYIFNENNLVIENFYKYHRLSENIGFHPTYLSIYTAFSAFSFLYFGLYEKSFLKSYPIFVWFLFLFALVQVYLLNSFAVVFSVLVIGVFSIYLFGNKFFAKRTLILVLMILGVGTTMIYLNKIRGINSEIFNFNYETPRKNPQWNSMNVRLAKWECALEVYKENAPIGVGTGCTQIKLMEKYKEKKFTLAYNANYTSHNMYLRSLVQMGILGFSLFLGFIIYGLLISIGKGNFVLLLLVLLLAISSMTEEVLALNKGVVFFSFFIVFFQKYSLTDEGIH